MISIYTVEHLLGQTELVASAWTAMMLLLNTYKFQGFNACQHMSLSSDAEDGSTAPEGTPDTTVLCSSCISYEYTSDYFS